MQLYIITRRKFVVNELKFCMGKVMGFVQWKKTTRQDAALSKDGFEMNYRFRHPGIFISFRHPGFDLATGVLLDELLYSSYRSFDMWVRNLGFTL